MTTGGLSAFEHRASYADVDGRDRWEVRAVNRWLTATLPATVAAAPPGSVLDVGCGEQPFRPLVEAQRRAYVGMDIVQNSNGTVALLGDLEHAETPVTPYAIVVCTEVLEHVFDVNLSFRGLRRLTMTGGLVLITVPFLFPEHMDPDDFRRLTEHGVAQLARDNGFSVVSSQRLGSAPEVVATMLADVSVLPSAPTVTSRLKSRVLRAAKAWLVARLASATLSDHVHINSNLYLSSGIVLKAVA